MPRPLVAYADMVGDLFHGGHVNFLRQLQELAQRRSLEQGFDGARVVVGLMGDEAAAQYKRAPVLTLGERVAIVAACRYVNEVIPGCPCPITAAFIAEHGIDLVVHGDDFDQSTLAHWYGEPLRLGILATVPYTHHVNAQPISTSAIIDRVPHAVPLSSAA